MGNLTNYAENELLDHVFNAAYSPVATLYLALCTADPTDAATGASCNETANSNNYSRKAITFGAAATRTITQSGAVTYDAASGDWASAITHWCIVDSATHGVGNALAYGAFNSSKTVYSGNTPSIADASVYVDFSANEISDYLTVKLLDLMFRNQAYAAPDTYVGLVTATISDSNTGSTVTEVSGGAYARQEVEANGGSSPTWDTAASGVVDNTHDIDFPTATASWGTVVAVFIADALTAGNLLMYDNALTDQAVGNGDDYSFPAGDLDMVMT